jgi:hypothetical protein
MRPMTLLASALFPSMLLAAVQIGCSSDDSSNSTVVNTPFDSGAVIVPASPARPGAVTLLVSGKGEVVSSDGKLEGTQNNGFAGIDGGAPIVDCPGACSAGQGTILYAYATSTGGDNVFLGWSVAGGEVISTDLSYTVSSWTQSPLTATFGPGGGPVTPPTPVADAGAGGG